MSEFERSDLSRETARPWARWLTLLGVTFVAGLLTMGWIVTRWDAAAPYLSWLRPHEEASPASPSLPAQPAAATQPSNSPPTPDVERRVFELEHRIGSIAERASAASGNADRAEGLLVAFAARRALDRGLQLGYLEGLLRARFGQTQPQAVATIIGASHKPVTLDELRAELEALEPELRGEGSNANWLAGFRRELANVVVVRRAETPAGTPESRLGRARRSLEAGHVDRALAEVARLPARERAQGWMGRARRYLAAHNALDLIETAALLTPTHVATPAVPDRGPAPKP